jgi:hypothetical protein
LERAAAGARLRLRRQRSSRSELCGSISFIPLFILARSPEIRPLTQRLPYHQNPRTRLVRFRSPHSRTDSSLAVQCQLRYTPKLRKSRVNSHYRNDKSTSHIRVLSRGGEGGIRTHGTVTRTTVFESKILVLIRAALWLSVCSSSPILPRRCRRVSPDTVLCRVVGLQFGLQSSCFS